MTVSGLNKCRSGSLSKKVPKKDESLLVCDRLVQVLTDLCIKSPESSVVQSSDFSLRDLMSAAFLFC